MIGIVRLLCVNSACIVCLLCVINKEYPNNIRDNEHRKAKHEKESRAGVRSAFGGILVGLVVLVGLVDLVVLQSVVAVVAAYNSFFVGVCFLFHWFGSHDTAVVATELVSEESVHLMRWLFVVP